MFTHHSHSYFIQAVALWFSFLPPLSIVALIAAAQFERLRRRRSWRIRSRRSSQAVLRSVQR
jgi:hypothetical protein